ncbi:hypothetical protein FRC07_011477 [Ceratobasidium sp. 392]|nr:hypothetical protein FRC07_011477 [Ceratobasidium sp. 392]
MGHSSDTGKGKGKAKQLEPRRPRRNQDDDRRSQQTQAAQAAFVSGKRRSAKSRARDGEEDEEMDEGGDCSEEGGDDEDGIGSDEDDMGGDEDDLDPSEEDLEDGEDVGDFEDADAQARLCALQEEMQQLKHALAESRATNRTEARKRALATNATPGASSSRARSTNALHPIASASRSVTGPSRSVANSAARPTNASHPAASGSRPSANTSCPSANNAHAPANPSRPPADEATPSRRTGANEPPPLIGVGAPSFIPYPKKATEMTMAKIWFGLGAVDRALWQAMQDGARQVALRGGLDFTKIWNRQSPDALALLYPIASCIITLVCSR